jgi:hypothetical protein
MNVSFNSKGISTTNSGGGGGGGNAFAGGQFKRKATQALTKEEKKKKQEQYTLAMIKAAKTGVSSSAFAVPIDAWEAKVENIVLKVNEETGSFITEYNSGTPENPKLGSERYVLPPGVVSYASNLGGIGSKYEGNQTQATATTTTSEASDWKYSCGYNLGLPIAKEIYDQCPTVGDQVSKTIAFFKARREKFINAAMDEPMVYAKIREKSNQQYEAAMSALEGTNAVLSEEKKRSLKRTAYEQGLKFGMEEKKVEDEQTKESYTFLSINMHSSVFVENKTGENCPDEVYEILNGKNPMFKEKAEIIKTRYETKNQRLREISFFNPDGTRCKHSIFKSPTTDGSTIIGTFNASAYANGDNNGITNYIHSLQNLVVIERTFAETDMHASRYIKAYRPHTCEDITVLTFMKKHDTTPEGVTLDNLKKFIGEKLPPGVVQTSLASLVDEGMICTTEDKKAFKLTDPQIDIDKIPVIVEEKPPQKEGTTNKARNEQTAENANRMLAILPPQNDNNNNNNNNNDNKRTADAAGINNNNNEQNPKRSNIRVMNMKDLMPADDNDS